MSSRAAARAPLLLAVLATQGCMLLVDGDPLPTCTAGDRVLRLGDTVPAVDGCNVCTCTSRGLSCTEAPCPQEMALCEHEGALYRPGERFAPDACNTCTCDVGGSLSCTSLACLPPGCYFQGRFFTAGATWVEDACTYTCRANGSVRRECEDPNEGCLLDGRRIAVGETVPGPAPFELCTCEAPRRLRCEAPTVCRDGEHAYLPGDVFTRADGCNRCRCQEDGVLACTELPTCDMIDRGFIERQSVRVVWVISNAVGARSLQQAVEDGIPDFLAPTDGKGVERVMAVTTTGVLPDPACSGPARGGEHGRFAPVDGSLPRFFDPDNHDARLFAPTARMTACHHSEQGLETGRRATSLALAVPDDPGTPQEWDGNSGFTLSGKVALIFATANDDHSPQPIDVLVEEIARVRPERLNNQLSVHALIGPPGVACQTRMGLRYRTLVERLGGTVEQLCDSGQTGSPFERLGAAALHYDLRLLLSETPQDLDGDGLVSEEAGEIAVLLDGVPHPSRDHEGRVLWRYDPVAVAVDLLAHAAPPPGLPWEVRYRRAPPEP